MANNGWRAPAGAVAALLVLSAAVSGQVIDRVVARVNGTLVLLSDVRAALGLGLIQDGPEEAQVDQLVRRQLLVNEVARFPPPEPDRAAVVQEMTRMRARVPDLASFQRRNGVSDAQIEALARESLRIESYLTQRFGTPGPVSDDMARDYHRQHPDEFLDGGARLPFERVAAEARVRAGEARRREAIAQWVAQLEARADIVVPGRARPGPALPPGR